MNRTISVYQKHTFNNEKEQAYSDKFSEISIGEKFRRTKGKSKKETYH